MMFGARAVAQTPTDWVAYTNGEVFLSVVVEAQGGGQGGQGGDQEDAVIWTGSSFGGLVMIDRVNDTTVFYNVINSPLPSNYVVDLAISPSGELWVVSGNELLMFHENVWTHYHTLNSFIPEFSSVNIDVTPSGDVWIGHEGGLIRLSSDSIGSPGSIVAYTQADWPLMSGAYSVKAAGNDSVWFITGFQGLVLFDGSSWSVMGNFDPEGSMAGIEIDAQDRVWVGSTNALGIYDGENLTVYDSTNSPLGMYNHRIAFGPDGDAYVGGLMQLSRMDASGNWTTGYYDQEWGGVIQTLDFFNGSLLVGTFHGGLLLQEEDGNWMHLSTSNSGLPSSPVTDFAFSDSVTVIATDGGGFAVFNDTDWVVYDTSNSDLPSDIVYSVAVDQQGGIWAGTNLGLARLYQGTFTVWTMTGDDGPFGSIPWEDIRDIYIDANGIVWTADAHALRYVEDDNVVMVEDSWDDFHYLSVVMDNNGTVWAANMQSGLVSWDGSMFSWHIAPSYQINSLALDRTSNALWIASLDAGLLQWDGSNFTTYSTSNSDIPSDMVLSVDVNAEGDVWMTTNAGLVKFDGQDFTLFNDSTHGIPLEYSSVVKVDLWNNKWIGNDGVIVYNEDCVSVDAVLVQPPVNNNITLWPSPARDHLQIKSAMQILQADVYSLNGKHQLTFEPGLLQFSMPLHRLKPGIYTVRIRTVTGTEAMKFVKM